MVQLQYEILANWSQSTGCTISFLPFFKVSSEAGRERNATLRSYHRVVLIVYSGMVLDYNKQLYRPAGLAEDLFSLIKSGDYFTIVS
jgi:hypothetical protein